MKRLMTVALFVSPLSTGLYIEEASGQPSVIRRVPSLQSGEARLAGEAEYRDQAGRLVWNGADGRPARIVTPRNLMTAADGYPLNEQELQEKGLQASVDTRVPRTVGSLRQEGFLFVDRETADSLRKTSACRYEVDWRLESGARKRAPWVLGCLIEPSVAVRVTQRKETTFDYTYTIANGTGAEQEIFWFQVRLPFLDALLGGRDVEGWRLVTTGGMPLNIEGSEGADFASLSGATKFVPGKEIAGLALESAYFPGVTEARFEGLVTESEMPSIEEALPDELMNAANDLTREGQGRVTRVTVGPVIPPPAVASGRAEVVARLQADVDRARSGGLVSKATASKLKSILADVAAALNDRGRLTDLAARVEALRDIDPGYRSGVAAAARVLAAQS